jgi:hypothetical protein
MRAVDGGMTTISLASARSSRSPTRSRPSPEEVARGSERRAFHDKVLDGIREFLEAHAMQGKTGPRDFYDFEKELHTRLMEVEREIVGDVMAASDVEADVVEIDGVSCRRVLKSAEMYMTAAGAVRVERWLYKDRRDPEAHAIAVMDKRLGIVEDFWTPRAAEQATWVVTQMTPQKSEDLFERVGNMAPSKSSLDRLPKAIGDRWEAARESNEQVLRDAIVVPEGARSIAVSLDGVLAPVDGGNSPTMVRNAAAAKGELSKGPAGYREVGCATISFCDDQGDLISAIRFGRGPEHKKATLKESLAKDVAHVLALKPGLRLCKIADAGGDNWEFLGTLPEGPEILDFFHATEKLSAAVAAAYGDGTMETRHTFERLRERLLTEDNGAKIVIDAVARLRQRFPRREVIAKTLNYLRKNRRRMRYAEWKREGYMIGSGVVEAACKTLVAQRLKLSGMRWGSRGAQAILTMRGWDQSDRFDAAWALVSATYHAEVHVLANVIDITPKSPKPAKKRRRP